MSAATPWVSVVIPAYNQAEYLGAAVQSVLAQTHHDREIIVIDDGSRDETPAIAAALGNTIRYIRQDNQGLAMARNAGIQASRGQYVAFLDSDDMWMPDFLAEVAACFERRSAAAAVYTGWRHMDSSGQDLPAASRRVVEPEQLYEELVRGNFVIPSAAVVRRDVLIDVGGFRNIWSGEDWDLWLRIACQHEMVGIPRVLVKYRLHDRSLTAETARSHWRAVHDVVVHHFGPEPDQWHDVAPIKRRAFGGVHAFLARRHLEAEEDEQAVEHVAAAFRADPQLASNLDFFYVLGLGRQPRGLRGSLEEYSSRESARLLLMLLDQTFRRLGPPFEPLHRAAYGTAHLALGTLAYGQPNVREARRHFYRSVRCDPRRLTDRRLLSTLAKSILLSDPLVTRLRGAAGRGA